MYGELLISLLDKVTDDKITTRVEATTNLAEDKADALGSTVMLELIRTDGERLISLLKSRAGDDIRTGDESIKDLVEVNKGEL